MWRIGIDEAGRGPVIGPLVVCALLIPEGDESLLKKAGVTDSKLLSTEKRLKLDAWIRKTSQERGWKFALHISEPVEIDWAMMATNLNDHEVSLFAKLASKLHIEEGGGILQVDACDADARRFGNNIASRLTDWPWEGWSIDSRHGADLYLLTVGAASILAKVARDRAIEDISAKLGFDVGSGYPSDPKTIAAIPKMIDGDCPHTSLRWKWATVNTAWQEKYGVPVPSRPRDGATPQTAQRTLF